MNDLTPVRDRKLPSQVKSVVMDGMRVCTRCNESKPNTEEFYRTNGRTKEGVQKFRPECRICIANKTPSKVPTYTYSTGDRYNLLTLVKYSRHDAHGTQYWICRCDCGSENEYQVARIRGGFNKSCGCKRLELLSAASTTHGKSRTPEYKIWGGMIDRCYNPDSTNYPLWGARGIAVCDRWRNSFEAFLEDMGPRPSNKHQIDRINNDGNYKPGNCRWATVQQQALNRRTSKLKNIVIDVGDIPDEELRRWEASPRLIDIFELVFGKTVPTNLAFAERLNETSAIYTCSRIN